MDEATETDSDASFGDSGIAPVDRSRGILSQADREYLLGLKEYEHRQSESVRKKNIRQRIKNSLKDFGYLWFRLDPSERKTIAGKFSEEDTNYCVESMIAFAFLFIEKDIGRMEKLTEQGITRGVNIDEDGQLAGQAIGADVSISISYRPDLDKLYQKVQKGDADDLSHSEIGTLVRKGRLEPDDLKEIKENRSTVPEIASQGDTEEQVNSSNQKKE